MEAADPLQINARDALRRWAEMRAAACAALIENLDRHVSVHDAVTAYNVALGNPEPQARMAASQFVAQYLYPLHAIPETGRAQ
ncbi:hypothetical protein [Muricoccus radiodurans]|uniref:hypothetical protein n=1 Tax=Muricoccus radiodurans TaxID=2231721 RepID=UPI003CEEF430